MPVYYCELCQSTTSIPLVTVHDLSGKEILCCKHCAETKYYYCTGCGHYHQDCIIVRDLENETEVAVGPACSTVPYFTCTDCRERFTINSLAEDIDTGETVCTECADDHWYYCDNCGRRIHSDNAHWSNDSDHCYCDDCYDPAEADEDSSDSIGSYHYFCNWKFYATEQENQFTDNKLYLGFELEAGKMESSYDADQAAVQAREDCGHLAVCEGDASIPGYGFELISHPCTLRYHKQAPWEVTFRGMSEAGLRSHDTGGRCGLHIHASRVFLTESRWEILEWFMRKYADRWKILARRCNSDYAMWDEPIDWEDRSDCGKSSERYRMLNFTNDNTVEFRLFRGTLKYSTVMATLELVDAVCRFIKDLSCSDAMERTNVWKLFCEYLQKSPELYKEAIDYAHVKNVWEE